MNFELFKKFRHTERQRKYPVTNTKELSCNNANYVAMNKKLDCFGSVEPHNDVNKSSELFNNFNTPFLEKNFSLFTSHFSRKRCLLMRGDVNKSSRKAAFTLAEVLITLGIIGVVAAITMPTLIQKYQEKQTVAALEKAYSVLSQVALQAQEEHGDISTWIILDENQNSTREIFSYFEPYFKIVRKCDNKPGCWAKNTMSLTGVARWSGNYYNGDKYINVTLADGMNLSFDICEPFYTVFGLPTEIMRPFIIFGVDTNGDKQPNTIGKDIFFFALGQKGIIPFGIGDNSKNCSKSITSNTSGYGCAYKVLQEKAINY